MGQGTRSSGRLPCYCSRLHGRVHERVRVSPGRVPTVALREQIHAVPELVEREGHDRTTTALLTELREDWITS